MFNADSRHFDSSKYYIISITWIISALSQCNYIFIPIPKSYAGFLLMRLTCFAPWICTTILCNMRKQIDDKTVLISRKWLTSHNILWAKKDIGLRIPTDTRYIPGRVVILSSHCKKIREYCVNFVAYSDRLFTLSVWYN